MTDQPHPTSFAPGSESAVDVLPATPAPTPQQGWTPARQAAFLRELAVTHNVSAAARAVGMGRQSAYKLRHRLRGTPFDKGWEAAFVTRFDALAEAALDRALNGTEVPHYYNGELIGTSRRYDERLTMALLTMRHSLTHTSHHLPEPAAAYQPDDVEALARRVEAGPPVWLDDWEEEHAERTAACEDAAFSQDLPDGEGEAGEGTEP